MYSEAAKRAGYMTGLVVTTDITDATPACFAAHAKLRTMEDSIAVQEVGEHPLGRVVDIMLGGGRCHFLPNSTEGSCRQDDRDIIKLAQMTYGWDYISDRAGFDRLKLGSAVTLPLLGLFADANIPYEIDRRNMNDVYPSLDEMAWTALRALDAATKNSDKGFFLMIEGSRIDHAGHGNDPAAQVHEVLAYDKTFASVLRFLEESETDGIVVSTSDHETGGLAVARRRLLYTRLESNLTCTEIYSSYPQYKWFPGALTNVSQSSGYLASSLREYVMSKKTVQHSSDDLKKYISETIVRQGLGIEDATDAEIQLVADHPTSSSYILADMVSRRAQIGWSTHGHSAVDVNTYGSAGSDPLKGNRENTEIGVFLSSYLDVDVDSITKELNEKIQGLTSTDQDYSNAFGGLFPNEEDILTASDHYRDSRGELKF
jgi:alkaline phosphatase